MPTMTRSRDGLTTTIVVAESAVTWWQAQGYERTDVSTTPPVISGRRVQALDVVDGALRVTYDDGTVSNLTGLAGDGTRFLSQATTPTEQQLIDGGVAPGTFVLVDRPDLADPSLPAVALKIATDTDGTPYLA